MPTQKAEKTKQFILDKSAAIFNQKGYAGTSLQDILHATQLSKGAVYGHFNGKDEIALAAFEHAVNLIDTKIRQRTQVIDNTLDKLKAVVYFYKEHVLNPVILGGCPIQNTAVEADDCYPILRNKALATTKLWHARLVHTIEKGKKRAEIKSDTDAPAFATIFIGMIEGGILLSQLSKEQIHFDIMAKQLLVHLEDIRL